MGGLDGRSQEDQIGAWQDPRLNPKNSSLIKQ
jgi:hypothetical protein